LKNFVVYKSSAGSGKTYTLVKEYLRLALCDAKKLNYNYKRILAVTFTNKAASEMKSRVIEALNQISHKSMPSVGKTLCEELKTSEEELRNRARIVLSHILHHYSDFSIGTIDSFTHKIVKTFAHDLKLPVNFNIELDTAGFYEKVISELFNQIGEDEYVSKLLKEFALSKAEDNAGWDPEKQIKEFSKLLLKENSDEYLEKLKRFNADELEKFRQQFIDYIYYYKDFLKTEAQKALTIIRKNNLSADDFKFKKNGPQNFFTKCSNTSVLPADTESARIKDAIENNQWAGTTSSDKKQIIETISPELNAFANKLIAFVKENYAYFSLCELLSKQMYPLMLLKKIEEISLEKKQEERLVFISEFNQKIFEIINNEPTPFIYERLGERYHHYLLDEFQDTSSLQWQNILPLLDNSLSNGWFNLIVGDGKQSIYRWRNANVKQFSLLPHIDNPAEQFTIEERALSLHRNFEQRYLETNYRSVKTIVEFNNSIFESLKETLLSGEYKDIYDKQAQIIKNENLGYITVNLNKVEKDELENITNNEIIAQINSSLEAGFEYKDICILARKNSHGNTIANFLMEQKIPVISSDSLLLKNNFEINTILCYLNYLVNNHDGISAAAVINYLFQSKQISESDFHTYLHLLSKNKSLFEILKSCNIDLNENNLSLNNLLDNCIEIITALNLNQTAYPYIRFFLDEVNEFLVSKNSNISSFFEWWERRAEKASMIIPENTNAVRIMTIHASKGLEFPVVIIPYCNWGIYQSTDAWVNIKNDRVNLPTTVISLTKKVAESGFEIELETEQQEQLLDNLNLLYVAFTRAVERLHIIAISATSNKFKLVSDWLREFMLQNHVAEQEEFYSLGQALKKQSAHTQHFITNFDLEPLSFNSAENVVQIKASYLNDNQEVEEAKKQGLLIHWLLSKIKSLTDVNSALEAGTMEGLINANEIPSLQQKLLSVIEHPELAAYFASNVTCKIEAEIVTREGDLLRPDRIVLLEKETVLIDYKTGKENNSKYLKQLLKYEQALSTMGYPPIKKLLVYVDDLKIVSLK
jgi:ATP-dependent exoDNAse (exonuclease V) beta subunit